MSMTPSAELAMEASEPGGMAGQLAGNACPHGEWSAVTTTPSWISLQFRLPSRCRPRHTMFPWQSRKHHESGATSIEYALLASLIAVAIFGAVLALGQTLPGIFDQVTQSF